MAKACLPCALALAAPLALVPVAQARSSRAATGGMGYVAQPVVRGVGCVKDCAPRRALYGGSKLRLTGAHLRSVTKVVFHGGAGVADDVAARVRPRSARSIQLVVPTAAPSGPVSAWAGNAIRSNRTKPLRILPPLPPIVRPELSAVPGPRDPGAPRVETGTSQAKVFFGAQRGVRFSFRVSDNGPVNTQVDLVRTADNAVVASWRPATLPGQVTDISWNGVGADGKVQPEGRYLFRLVASGAGGARARSAQVGDVRRDAFDFYRHIFPVRGPHDFGEGGARFGAGRAGHSHQGQDVFARCGTKLVAARGGVVKFEQYHSAAGHYIVIDGNRTPVDYAYMHLTGPSPFDVGDRVYTGQQIGTVGESGNARGCHLHFEMWSAPGWYDGGHPFDPFADLQAWDRVS